MRSGRCRLPSRSWNQIAFLFYRLHRSYFVNCNYVAKIERYKLTLITGEELPIPKMRYMQIRSDITEMIQRKKSKRALTWNKRTTGKGKSSCFCIVK